MVNIHDNIHGSPKQRTEIGSAIISISAPMHPKELARRQIAASHHRETRPASPHPGDFASFADLADDRNALPTRESSRETQEPTGRDSPVFRAYLSIQQRSKDECLDILTCDLPIESMASVLLRLLERPLNGFVAISRVCYESCPKCSFARLPFSKFQGNIEGFKKVAMASGHFEMCGEFNPEKLENSRSLKCPQGLEDETEMPNHKSHYHSGW